MDILISPLDGRYGSKLSHLSQYFSEFALMRMRVIIELWYLEALDRAKLFERLTNDERRKIKKLQRTFCDKDYKRIKTIEKKINHDVKACEVFLRETLGLKNSNLIHFGLTSEDVNNLAYTHLFNNFKREQQLPHLRKLLELLCDKAEAWKKIPFPARTHGQMASPSTAGKEISVYIQRILRQFKRLNNFRFMGKLNGATGNYSALLAAFPEYDWIKFSGDFISRHGLEPNLITTQIEDHDTWAHYFSIIKQINNIIIDLNRDIWIYLTLGYMTIAAEKDAVGSSTMPHKVNPINFENSEGNLQVSNSLLGMLIDKLTNSRMQRDLSDSTVTRNVGVALAHSFLALQETVKGLKKLEINERKCKEELEQYPELLAEPIQTILRKEGFEDPYSLMKDLTRGRRISKKELVNFINNLKVKDEVKERLKALEVIEYTGEAARICDMVLNGVKKEFEKEDKK